MGLEAAKGNRFSSIRQSNNNNGGRLHLASFSRLHTRV
jgi:hypothetical protein